VNDLDVVMPPPPEPPRGPDDGPGDGPGDEPRGGLGDGPRGGLGDGPGDGPGGGPGGRPGRGPGGGLGDGPGGGGRRRRGGVHRREGERRWPWLAALGTVAAVAGVVLAWLVSGLGGGEPAARRSTLGVTPPYTIGSDAGPMTSVRNAGSTPAPPTPTAAPTPTTSPTPEPSRSRRPATAAPIRTARVPDVVGQREERAVATLRAAGYAASVVPVPVEQRRQDRRVVGQRPGAGVAARPGSVVTILVGRRA